MDISPAALAARALRTRALVRAPITLYRHDLGWIFGQRILMLEHTGCRSGQARFACLEVVGRPGPERIIIVSGFGERAEWYRNLLADPNGERPMSQRPPSRVCGAHARTAPSTCRFEGFTSARPAATTTVGTVSFPSATERTNAFAPGSRRISTLRYRSRVPLNRSSSLRQCTQSGRQ